MLTRRSILQGPAFGGLLASLTPASEPGAAAEPAGQKTSSEEAALQDVTNSIRTLRDEIKRQNDFWELATIRDPIKTFLRANGKFPDYMEVGVDLWQQAYDWHIRYQLSPAVGRNPDGRYTLMLMTTTLVMRVDAQPTYVGVPFDNR